MNAASHFLDGSSQGVYRVVFMGTPDFAVPSLEAIMQLGAIDGQEMRVVGVFTQPDRPAGRGQKLSISPIKALALAAGVAIFQPERLRRPEGIASLASVAPDLIVVAAYAQLLPAEVLGMPRFGCLNVHASLLPSFRGASPIQAAILAGVDQTGVTIMRMDEGLDTGPILAQAPLAIDPDDTGGTLGSKLAVVGARLLAHTIPPWLTGQIQARPQSDAPVTLTRRLDKSDGKIDWNRSAEYIARQVRALTPWPGTFTMIGGAYLKVIIVRASVERAPGLPPGTVIASGDGPRVVTGSGEIILELVQPAGKRAMPAADWLRGVPRGFESVLR